MTVKTIVCFGDSNTWGYDPQHKRRFPPEVRWPGALRQALGDGYHVIEEGLGGRTTVWDDPTEAGRRGLDYLYPCLLSHRPLDLLILLLGTNDTKPRFAAAPVDIARGMERLVRVAQMAECGPQDGVPQILVVAPPLILPLAGTPFADQFVGAEAKSAALGRYYEAMAAERGVHFFNAADVIASSPLDAIHWSGDAQQALGRALADRTRAIFGA